MTTLDVIKHFREKYPEASVNVEITHWWHASDESSMQPSYNVTIVFYPAKGTTISGTASTLEGLLTCPIS